MHLRVTRPQLRPYECLLPRQGSCPSKSFHSSLLTPHFLPSPFNFQSSNLEARGSADICPRALKTLTARHKIISNLNEREEEWQRFTRTTETA